jgi:hypothetical protein
MEHDERMNIALKLVTIKEEVEDVIHRLDSAVEENDTSEDESDELSILASDLKDALEIIECGAKTLRGTVIEIPKESA